MFSCVYTQPTGLFGELMTTAAVFPLMASRSASISSWKSVWRIGTSTHAHCADSIITLYSVKYGAFTMTSSPGWLIAAVVM